MSNYLMVPSKTVKVDLVTKNEQIVYIPIATRETYGSVKIGDGLNINNGVISFDESQITIKTISKNGVNVVPDKNKNVNIVVSKSDVNLENVDNTSDLDKPISILQQAEFDKKVNVFQGITNVGKGLIVNNSGNLELKELSSVVDKNVLTNLSAVINGDTFNLVKTFTNLKSFIDTTELLNLTLANDTQSGLMSTSDYKSIRDLQARVGQLENKTTRLLYGDKLYPTAEEINAFVTGLGYVAPFDGVAVIVDGTNHIWHYYENDNIGWKDDGLDVVSQFTNDIAGIIKGSAIEGKVYAETDGTGSVYGWDNLKTSIANKASQSDLTTETNARLSYQTTNDAIVLALSDSFNTLNSDVLDLKTQIESIDLSNVVDLTSAQTISGAKTFTGYLSRKASNLYGITLGIGYAGVGMDFMGETILVGRPYLNGNNISEAILIGTNSGNGMSRGSIAIGHYTETSGNGAIAIGYRTGNAYVKALATDAIQLGIGTNSTAKTFQVYTYTLLDGNTGLIPNDRLSLGTITFTQGETILGTYDGKSDVTIDIPAGGGSGTVPENMVTTDTIQEITGVKTFVEQVGLKNTDGTINYIKHLNNNFLISTSDGTNLLNIDEQLETVQFFNREIAYKDEIPEIPEGTGTSVTVDGAPQTVWESNTKVDKQVYNGDYVSGIMNNGESVNLIARENTAGGNISSVYLDNEAAVLIHQHDLDTKGGQIGVNADGFALMAGDFASNDIMQVTTMDGDGLKLSYGFASTGDYSGIILNKDVAVSGARFTFNGVDVATLDDIPTSSGGAKITTDGVEVTEFETNVKVDKEFTGTLATTKILNDGNSAGVSWERSNEDYRSVGVTALGLMYNESNSVGKFQIALNSESGLIYTNISSIGESIIHINNAGLNYERSSPDKTLTDTFEISNTGSDGGLLYTRDNTTTGESATLIVRPTLCGIAGVSSAGAMGIQFQDNKGLLMASGGVYINGEEEANRLATLGDMSVKIITDNTFRIYGHTGLYYFPNSVTLYYGGETFTSKRYLGGKGIYLSITNVGNYYAFVGVEPYELSYIFSGLSYGDNTIEEYSGTFTRVKLPTPSTGTTALLGSLITEEDIPDISSKADLTNTTQTITANDIVLQGFSMFDYCADLGARDYIVEQGTNYVRWNNGLQICWGVNIQSNYSTDQYKIYFPMPFLDTNYALSITPIFNNNYDTRYATEYTNTLGQATSRSTTGTKIMSSVSNSWYVVGRWK